MNLLLKSTARALTAKGHLIRYSPVDYIPMEERRRMVECLSIHLHRFASSIGVDLGRLPTVLIRADAPFDPADVLENVARLNLDTVAIHNVLGTSDVARDAFEGVADSHVVSTYRPNFKALIAEALEPRAQPEVD